MVPTYKSEAKARRNKSALTKSSWRTIDKILVSIHSGSRRMQGRSCEITQGHPNHVMTFFAHAIATKVIAAVIKQVAVGVVHPFQVPL